MILTHTHTSTHACSLTHAYTRTCTNKHTHSHAYIDAYTHTRSHTHAHTRTQAWAHTVIPEMNFDMRVLCIPEILLDNFNYYMHFIYSEAIRAFKYLKKIECPVI